MKHFALWVLSVVFYKIALMAQVNPYGQPFIRNYSLKDFRAKSQNWAIARDTRGVMYFANNDGVLEYDGQNWELIGINKGAIVRSLAIDSAGVIYVGAENEFGYIQPDGIGKLYYRSLSDSLPSTQQGFSDINKVYVTATGILFCSNKKIFKYYKGKTAVIDLPKGGFLPFLSGSKIYMGDYWEGLMALDIGKFSVCRGGEFYAKKDVFGVLPLKNDLLLIATNNDGLFVYNPNTGKSDRPQTSKYNVLHKYITSNSLYGISLYNGGYRINTLYGGVVIADSLYDIKEIYSKAEGLQDEVILGDFLTRQGSANEPLWLALNNGIAKVEVNSPFRIFSEAQGLNEEILDIFEYNHKMYFATINGVYTLSNLKNQPHFTRLDQTEGECWSMVQSRGKLIIGGSYNLYIYQSDRISRVETDDMVFKLCASKMFPNTVFVGENKGLSIFKHENDKLFRVSKIKNINERVLNIVEDSLGAIWLSTSNNHIFRIIISGADTLVKRCDSILSNEQKESTAILKLGEKIYFSTHSGLWHYKYQTARVEIVDGLEPNFKSIITGTSLYCEDLNDNLWLVTAKTGKNEIVYVEKNNSGKFNVSKTPFKRMPTCIVNSIYSDSKGLIWIATSEGLFTFNPFKKVAYNEPYKTLIRKVYIGEDSLIFTGAFFVNGKVIDYQPHSQIPVIEYRNNGVTFYFSAPYFIEENETRYSYYLEGFDTEKQGWSNWTTETKKEYTNLTEGNYLFKVKAKNIFGIESSVAEFAFRIKPPWYRTVFAYISYILLLSLFIWIVVKLNIRRLEKDKEKLECIVRERTAEIRQQKEKIEKQKEEITDSIKYAKRIQTAVLPPAEIISTYLPEHFILFKPRDIVSGDFYWMKQVDDYTLIAAADCTGHGVPGAFMSMLGIAFLNEIATHRDIFSANEILNELRNQVKQSLRQTGKEGEAKDGMDIAFCVLNRKLMKLQYAGAYNPLYLYRSKTIPNPLNSECVIESDTHYLIEIKADKMPIGIHVNDSNIFTNHEIDIMPGDSIYIFSDGFADQTGGESDKKFLSKNFKNLLLNIQHLEMAKQKEFLEETLKKWMGNTSQVDDILVIGVRI